MFNRLKPAFRMKVYKGMLTTLEKYRSSKNYSHGLCDLAIVEMEWGNLHSPRLYPTPIKSYLPELLAEKPKNLLGAWWYPLNAEGLEQRIVAVENAILNLEIKMETQLTIHAMMAVTFFILGTISFLLLDITLGIATLIAAAIFYILADRNK